MDVGKKLLDSFSNLASLIGYSDVHGRIIAALMINDVLSLKELAEKTGYSMSQISISLDLLEIVGMVKKIKEQGDRKLYVELDGDLLEGLRTAIVLKIKHGASNVLDELEELKREADKNSMNAITKLEKEIKRLDKYVDKLSDVEIPKN